MTPGPSSLVLRMQKSSNLVGFSKSRTSTTSTKPAFAPKVSPNDGGKTTTKLSHQSPGLVNGRVRSSVRPRFGPRMSGIGSYRSEYVQRSVVDRFGPDLSV